MAFRSQAYRSMMAVQFNLYAAAFMDIFLGLVVVWAADFTGWYAIRSRDSYPESTTWWMTVLLGVAAIIVINILWIYYPDVQAFCWSALMSAWTYWGLGVFLLISYLMLQSVRPLERDPWKSQVLWGSLLNTWWGLLYCWLVIAACWFARKVDYDWP